MTTTLLLTCGAISGPLFVVTFLITGTLRKDYRQLRHPVSSLALGEYGWVQVVNFIVTGLLTLAFAVGLWQALLPLGGSTLVPVLIGLHGLGLVGAGVFITDPVSGYPPGTPDLLVRPTRLGALHDLFSLPTFVGWPIACIVLGFHFMHWDEFGWAVYSWATGLVFIVGLVVTNIGFAQVRPLVQVGGLLQRLTVMTGFGWVTLLAVHLIRV
jgi:hypothetical protein